MLMIYYIHSKNSPRDHLMPRFVEVGLWFSLVGDIMLMVNEEVSFIVGTLFFMVGHSFYIVAFLMGEEVKDLEGDVKMLRWIAYVVIVLLLFGNTYSLW